MRIRPATLDDAEAVAAVHVASWQATYRGVFADEVLDGPDLLAGRRRLWQRLLGPDAPAGHVTWVAEVDGEVVGFAGVRPSGDDDAGASTGEVWGIYARHEAWGSGAGRQLMSAALDALRARDLRTVTLWVLDCNERARRFYGLAGFVDDGVTKTEAVAGSLVTEVRYRRQL